MHTVGFKRISTVSIRSYLSVTIFLHTQVQKPHIVIITIYGIELMFRRFRSRLTGSDDGIG